MGLSDVSVCLLLVTFLPLFSQGAPEVQFSFGRVQGIDEVTQSTQKPYNAYYGIPFAQPPLGNLRFRAPQPFVGSGPNVVISSNNFRNGCSQTLLSGSRVSFSEDCLYLNIFTPADLSNVKKVMFWIHGGGYSLGDASSYKPSRMVTDYDVIVVTTQYRLGPFGFLNAGKGNANIGLRDQILALKWVKDNIGQFGGDPNDITIFGESAGSTSVSLLSLSPMTKGLFTKAIMQSGTALSPFALANDRDNLGSSADKLGCAESYWYLRWFNKEQFKNNILECLRSKSEQEILSLQAPADLDFSDLDPSGGMGDASDDKSDFEWDNLFAEGTTYAPVVDSDVIPRDPRAMLADRQYLEEVGALDRDYIIGFTNNEGLLVVSFTLAIMPIDTLTQPENAPDIIKATVKPMFPLPYTLTPHVMDLLNYQYSYPRLEDGRVPIQGLLDVSTDVFYTIPTVQFARALTKASDRTNVYIYLFDHYPEPTDPTSPLKGSIHALDLLYEFDEDKYTQDYISFYATVPSQADGNLADIFSGALTQFAKTGNPARDTGEPGYWPRYDSTKEYFLAISPVPEVRQHVYAKRTSLWTEFLS